MAYWVTFEDGSDGCVEFNLDDKLQGSARKAEVKALTEAQLGRKVAKVEDLPWPAQPRLIKVEDEKYGACPSFCFTPRECVGRSSCPKSYACTE